MKKLAIALALVLSLSLFAACGSSAPSDASAPSSESTSQPAGLPADLNDAMDKLFEGVAPEELPMLVDEATLNEVYGETQQEGDRYRRVTEESSEYDVGVAHDAYKEALISESMMGAVPYTVALLRADSAEAASKLAEDVKANVNPRKWVCVEADHVVVEQIDDVVLLAMYGEDLASVGDKIVANFKALAQ